MKSFFFSVSSGAERKLTPPLISHPTKSASDIAELDYENRLVRYREYRTEGDIDTTQQSIAIPPSADEGFNDWYDIDYYELYDYYHD